MTTLKVAVVGRRRLQPNAPANTAAPVLSGSVAVGQTLSCTNGTWTNSPTSFTYEWKRNGTIIAGQVASTYILVTADAAALIICTVFARNAAGTARQASNSLGPVSQNAPSNTVLPAISGVATEGHILSVTQGTWTNVPTGYAYQWKRNGSNIGTNLNTYTLVTADIGATITCVVTATNASGSVAATATGVGPITAAPAELSAPVLGYPSPLASNPATISIDLPVDWQKDDILKVKIATNLAFSTGVQNLTHTLTDADAVPGATITITLPTFSGVNYIKAWGSHSGVDSSNVSNVVSWGDSTAPVFTSSASSTVTETIAVDIALTFSASDVAKVEIFGGPDQLQFEAYQSSGAWHVRGYGNKTFLTTAPLDAGADSIYNFTIRATDYGGNHTDQSYVLTISAADLTPTGFSFTDVTGATRSTDYTAANTVTVAGLGTGINAPLTVSGGLISKNGGTFTAVSQTVQNGDTINVKGTSSSAYSSNVNIIVTIGTVSDTFTIGTASDPTAASFIASSTQPAPQNLSFGAAVATFSADFQAGRGVAYVAAITNSRTASSVTINGVACTRVAIENAHDEQSVWVTNSALAAGTYNVVVTQNNVNDWFGVLCGTLINAAFPTAPSSTASKTASSVANPVSTSAALTIPSQGVGVAFAMHGGSVPRVATNGTLIAAGLNGINGGSGDVGLISRNITPGSWTPGFSADSQNVSNILAVTWGP